MLINNEFNEEKIQSPLQYIWALFKKNNFAVFAMWVSILLVVIVLLADVIVLHSPFVQYPEHLLLPPYWIEGGTTEHIFGTDDLGRDALARLIKGFQYTFGGALLITCLISLIGAVIGATAALTKGIKASILHHLLDALLTIPTLLIALILIVLFGTSYQNCLIAVSLSLLPQFVRGIYLAIVSQLSKQHIIALRLDGATNIRLLRFGIFPNILEPLVTLINQIFTMAILEIATLGFLGFGTQSPDIELGRLIADNIELSFLSPWLIILPGLLIFLTIMIVNIFTEGLRHAIIQGED
ncbi:ABC transporter permease subunit [Psychromonas sp.]|uniref:ABC transporter permease subunit n=1 Tax=Psychromonas sp. TaxID=1884585 RepID=UPI00356403F8